MQCLKQENIGETMLILIICTVVVLMMVNVIATGVEANKYNEDCKTFTKNVDKVPYVDCISYLREFPTMTGQEMIDYHDSRADRLLDEHVYMRHELNNDNLKRSISYEYYDFTDACYAFVPDVKDVFGLQNFKINHCFKYLEGNYALTGKEMLNLYMDETSEKEKVFLKNQVYGKT